MYEAAGGAGGLLALARAWHARVMADEVVSHAFSHGYHPEHSERLAAYWAEALGGPATYTGAYGDETSVVRIHSGNGPHEEMDRRAIACFDQALADTGLAGDGRLRQVAARLLRVGHHHDDVPLSPVRGRRAGRPAHPALVLGRARHQDLRRMSRPSGRGGTRRPAKRRDRHEMRPGLSNNRTTSGDSEVTASADGTCGASCEVERFAVTARRHNLSLLRLTCGFWW